MEHSFTLCVLVVNHFGVLTRVSSLFSRRGYNIDSLTVGETHDREISRMTIVSHGDEATKEQIVKQLNKLIDVKQIMVMDEQNTVSRELMLIKVCADKKCRGEIIEAVNVYRGKIVDLKPKELTIEITGPQSKLDALIEYLGQFGIIELSRTGITAMGRGDLCLQV